MNADLQLEHDFRSWLQREPDEPANRERVIGDVLARVPTTPQKRRLWASLRLRQAGGPTRDVDVPCGDLVVPVVAVRRRSGRQSVRRFAFATDALLVAAAVVVLVGGVLLATTTIDRGIEVAAAPATTAELLAGLTVEAIEPGVLRILGDDFRDLTEGPHSSLERPFGVATGPDGSVWIHGRTGTVRLGVAGTSADGVDSTSGFDFDNQVGVAPDGTVWALRSAIDIPASEYQDCLNWTDCPWARRGDALTGDALIRLGLDGSVATMPSWSNVHAGPVAQGISVGPDGSVWLMGLGAQDDRWAQELLRFDGTAWEALPVPPGVRNNTGSRGDGKSFDIGPDGTLWAGMSIDTGDDAQVVLPDGVEFGRDVMSPGLARLDASGWTVFTVADGVQEWGSKGGFGDDLDMVHAAPDGSVWVNVGTGLGNEDGVARFDGTVWSSYLRGLKVHDLAIAADGSVWVSADTVAWGGLPVSKSPGRYGLYVILPNAPGD